MQRITEGSNLWTKVYPHHKAGEMEKMVDAIYRMTNANLCTDFIEVQRRLKQIEAAQYSVIPLDIQIEMNKLYRKLEIISGADALGSTVAATDRHLVKGMKFFGFIASMLNNKAMGSVFHAFVSQYVAVIQEPFVSVDLDKLQNVLENFVRQSKECHEINIQAEKIKITQKSDASAAKARAISDTADPKSQAKIIANLVNQEVQKRMHKQTNSGATVETTSKKHKTTKTLVLLPFAEKCKKCIARKHIDGIDDEKIRINHRTEECTYVKPSVNMMQVDNNDAAAQILDVSTNLLTHNIYIDSGANALIINKS
jgi:hypothetical protein